MLQSDWSKLLWLVIGIFIAKAAILIRNWFIRARDKKILQTMKSYDQNGFLSGQIGAWIEAHQESHRDIIDRAQKLNRDCHRFLDDRSPNWDDEKQVVSYVLFIRILELYQAIIVVDKHGMTTPTQIIFRSLIEAGFHFFAIQKDADYLNDYFNQFHIQRQKLVNRLRNSTSDLLSTHRDSIDDTLLDDVKRLIEEYDAKQISMEEVARRAGQHEIYLTAYETLSREVHASISALDSHVRFNEVTKEIEGFKYGPSQKETARIICLSGLCLAEILGEVSNLFGEDLKDLTDSHQQAFRGLLENK